MDALIEKYKSDQIVWDECADTYERQIVGGHPDILAYEDFEEDFLDRLLIYLSRNQDKKIKLMDIGCGSGRLHLRYGAKCVPLDQTDENSALAKFKAGKPNLSFDKALCESLDEVWGIDFSQNMLDLAKSKFEEAGLVDHDHVKLSLEQGSAFELKPEPDDVLPVAICLVNSIGVMQGPAGAVELFKSMRNAVEKAGGIAIISNFQQEYVGSYALGQYESTMDVSGQPVWVEPDDYASDEFTQIPRKYKRAHSTEDELIVDVFDANGKLVKENHVLKRNPDKVKQTIETGDINTHSDYESHWYSFEIMDEWIKQNWGEKSYHIPTKKFDVVRAEPAQFSIYDPANHLGKLLTRWGVI